MSLQAGRLRVMLVAVIALAAALATVWITGRAESAEVATLSELTAPAGGDGWAQSAEPVAWRAAHLPTPHKIEAGYASGDAVVQLYVILFPSQRQGNEAINRKNKIADDLQRFNDLGTAMVALGDDEVAVNRARVVVSNDGILHEHLVWQWYRVAGRSLTNRYEGKAWEALARLWPGRADGAWVAITTPLNGEGLEVAERRLAGFARGMVPRIDDAIDAVLDLEE